MPTNGDKLDLSVVRAGSRTPRDSTGAPPDDFLSCFRQDLKKLEERLCSRIDESLKSVHERISSLESAETKQSHHLCLLNDTCKGLIEGVSLRVDEFASWWEARQSTWDRAARKSVDLRNRVAGLEVDLYGECKEDSFETPLEATQRDSPYSSAEYCVVEERAAAFDDVSVFCIQVTTNKKKLGVAVDYADAKTLQVVQVHEEGVIAEWNCKNPDKVVESGDHILAVNARRGVAGDLLEEVKSATVLEMQIDKKKS
jgi:hypothetical protein